MSHGIKLKVFLLIGIESERRTEEGPPTTFTVTAEVHVSADWDEEDMDMEEVAEQEEGEEGTWNR